VQVASAPTDAAQLLFERVQELQQRLDQHGERRTRELADELVGAVVEMYGIGLERILTRLLDSGAEGERLAAALGEDQFVSTLLLIHDLHPVALEQRVQAALDSVRPYMESHGGSVELLGIADGVARIHLRGSCSDCSASSVTLELAIKQALEEAAPDLAGLEVEGVAPQLTGLALPMAGSPEPSGLELPVVIAPAGAAANGSSPAAAPPARARPAPAPPAPAPPAPAPAWHELDVVAGLAEGELASVSVAQQRLVVARIDGTLLAYRDACAACGGSLANAELDGAVLRCPGCARAFLLPRAGRSLEDERIQLEPVPLLRDGGGVRVALAV
jgi:Fe-S cluster biogenesis protein NfuA/nitrite reductase/ring-hydroxylating ferredoxin subunit